MLSNSSFTPELVYVALWQFDRQRAVYQRLIHFPLYTVITKKPTLVGGAEIKISQLLWMLSPPRLRSVPCWLLSTLTNMQLLIVTEDR